MLPTKPAFGPGLGVQYVSTPPTRREGRSLPLSLNFLWLVSTPVRDDPRTSPLDPQPTHRQVLTQKPNIYRAALYATSQSSGSSPGERPSLCVEQSRNTKGSRLYPKSQRQVVTCRLSSTLLNTGISVPIGWISPSREMIRSGGSSLPHGRWSVSTRGIWIKKLIPKRTLNSCGEATELTAPPGKTYLQKNA